jgi:hypothetical protein
MNTLDQTRPTTSTTPANPAPRVVPFDLSARPGPRERDYGVGYGKSSGYASNRRYTSNWAGPRFRIA